MEKKFDRAMFSIYETAKRECGYNANRFLQMLQRDGGLHTARNLLAQKGHPEGLTVLWEKGRLDITLEALVIKEPWCVLFTDAELEVARSRLESLGYRV